MFKRKERASSKYLFRLPLLLIIPFLCYLPFTSIGEDMFGWLNWFKKKEAYLSPIVKGVIKENGKPVANLQIIRELIYIDEVVRVDHATTDEKGHFFFPEKKIMSRYAGRVMVEQRVSQEIWIERDNDIYRLWGTTQTAYKQVPEFSKKLNWLNCELTDKRVTFEFSHYNPHRKNVATSICRWEEDYEPFLLYKNGKKYFINNGDFEDLTEKNIYKE